MSTTDDFCPLTFEAFDAAARRTDQQSDGGSITFPLLGLFGETGSLLSEVKKKHRDKASYIGLGLFSVSKVPVACSYRISDLQRTSLVSD